MRAVIIMDDKETLENIISACRMYWADMELVSTNLGERGVELIKTKPPDIIFLDLNLPDIGGIDTLKEIRRYSHAPVIVLSFLRDETDIVKCLEFGADECIVKPFRQLELIAYVRALLRKADPIRKG